MTIRGRKINGKLTAAIAVVLLTSLIGWGAWTTTETNANSKGIVGLDTWTKTHEDWTATTLAGLLDKINFGQATAAKEVKTLGERVTERFDDKRQFDEGNWANQREANREIMAALREIREGLRGSKP